ncbi:histone acetyltransferase [Thraustotheca clavata]|uniref:histone acetyltransferase n=1 Tax=Thraustotheca clavata TaxID=74557 RepID=A0A1W0A4I1_9STRA|nr:histone acetyltransferase [Thraustotheca clavata]
MNNLKRPRPNYSDSPSEVECHWDMGKIPYHGIRHAMLSPLEYASAPQLRQQIQDLRREKITAPLLAIVSKLMLHRANQSVFNFPVDPVRSACPTYYDVIKHPKDLGTIKQNLIAMVYPSADHVAQDVRLVFNNAMLFNPPDHIIHEVANMLLKEFEREYASYQRREADHANKRADHSCPHCQGHVCGLCEEKCINFEPPLVMCLGKCGQRLRRGGAYFSTSNGALNWCAKCVPKQKEFSFGDRIIVKSELVKAKFQDELTEPWVQCDVCSGWVHQICAMFNGEITTDDDSPFTCPLCRLNNLEASELHLDSVPMSPLLLCDPVLQSPEKLEINEVTGSPKRVYEDMSTHSPVAKKAKSMKLMRDYMPEDNVSTHLGTFMQTWVRDHILSLGESQQVADSITVKLASSIRMTVPISAYAQDHFRLNGFMYPKEVTYTSKTILVFQEIDGTEVCLFSMYVQEYGADCGIPSNSNRTYIAYLDSLGYFRPRTARTSVYQQLVISYLAYAKLRNFTHAHIWACPTTRGGDFIYWCHPVHQRNPNKERLLLWYKSVIAAAKARHVAFGHETLWSSHFEALQSGISNAPLPPYFDGDYWPAELERVVLTPPKRSKKKKVESEHPTINVKARDAIKAEVYWSIQASKDSLFVIPLQPQCSRCDSLLINVAYWQEGSTIFCDSCVDLTLSITRQTVPSFVHDGIALEDPQISCPFLNNRSDLLKHCEELHFQFDTLRRAKYSTMMMQYHMRTETHLVE